MRVCSAATGSPTTQPTVPGFVRVGTRAGLSATAAMATTAGAAATRVGTAESPATVAMPRSDAPEWIAVEAMVGVQEDSATVAMAGATYAALVERLDAQLAGVD